MMLGDKERYRREIEDFFRSLDRSYFLSSEYKEYAHWDRALPIGHEQTISQPSLVVEMTVLLELSKDARVLEIGTGSGYQTVFLAEFAGAVYTVERIRELADQARERLRELGYKNIEFKVGDGSLGWEEYAPYDRIIVTAGASQVPEELVRQLAPGGRMVIPVGRQGCQELLLITKDREDQVAEQNLGKVAFVELKGKYGWTKI